MKQHNPFLQDVPVYLNRGKLKLDGTFTDSYFHEKNTSIKLFRNGGLLELIPTLKRPSQYLLMWLLKHCQRNEDTIKLSQEKFTKWSGQGRSSYYEGKRELLTKNIIARGKGGRYWLNTQLFFFGNYIEYATENRVLKLHERSSNTDIQRFSEN